MKARVANRIVYLLACAGSFVALVLGMAHLAGAKLPCGVEQGIPSGCDVVAQSPVSSLFGIPIAFFGLALYLVVAVGSLLRERLVGAFADTLGLALFGLLAAGTLISAGLLAYAWIALNAVCLWCTASGLLMALPLFVQSIALQETQQPARSAPAWLMAIPLIVALGAGAGYGVSLTRQAEAAIRAQEYHLTPGAVLEREVNHVLGSPDAPVTMVVFADLECPACRRKSMLSVMEQVEGDLKDKVRLVYRHYVKANSQALSFQAAVLAEWCGKQGKFWQFVKAFLQKGTPSQTALLEAVRAAGLDARAAERLLKNPDAQKPYVKKLETDRADAEQLEVTMTPVWYVRYPNGKVDRAFGQGVFRLLSDAAIRAHSTPYP